MKCVEVRWDTIVRHTEESRKDHAFVIEARAFGRAKAGQIAIIAKQGRVEEGAEHPHQQVWVVGGIGCVRQFSDWVHDGALYPGVDTMDPIGHVDGVLLRPKNNGVHGSKCVHGALEGLIAETTVVCYALCHFRMCDLQQQCPHASKHEHRLPVHLPCNRLGAKEPVVGVGESFTQGL